MLGGHLAALIKRKKKLVNKQEERFYKRQLNKRILKAITRETI